MDIRSKCCNVAAASSSQLQDGALGMWDRMTDMRQKKSLLQRTPVLRSMAIGPTSGARQVSLLTPTLSRQ